MRLVAPWFCVAAAALSACGSDDVVAAGDYAVTVTNRDNGCNLPSWTFGASTAATVTLTQSQNDVTAVVTGLAAIALDLGLGGHSYTGKIHGDSLDLRLFGTRSATSGNCTYTLNSEIRAVLSGDTLDGQIDYTSATNGNPDCAGIESCDSFQELTGTRNH
ncbi:MAG TPA: hypothetical protein VK607_26445 [Kofleriaceae bacterium]|nr:hypothetical protein [Kofleriaceae bacterium]